MLLTDEMSEVSVKTVKVEEYHLYATQAENITCLHLIETLNNTVYLLIESVLLNCLFNTNKKK